MNDLIIFILKFMNDLRKIQFRQTYKPYKNWKEDKNDKINVKLV